MNIFREIEKQWKAYPDKLAMTIRMDSGEYRDHSFARLFGGVRTWADILGRSGILPGDRIALIAENSPEWVISFLAISNLDCTAVLIDPSLPDVAVADLIKRSDPRCVMASAKLRGRLSTDLPVFDIFNEPGVAASGMDGRQLPRTAESDPDIAAILFSSGTTSTAKGVMHRHDALLTMAEKINEPNGIAGSDRFLAVIPLYHIYGFMSGLVCSLIAGAEICFLESATSEGLSAAFREFKPTGFAGVPRIFQVFKSRIQDTIGSKGPLFSLLFRVLLASCDALWTVFGINAGAVLFSAVHASFGGAVRGFLSGGAYLDPEIVRFFHGLGIPLLNHYGLTETGIPVAANSIRYSTQDTCGRICGGIRVTIRSAGGPGEILVKSPGMMVGYFRDGAATAAAFDAEGWFLTGDLGYLNERGDLIVTGRTKENIVLATGKKLAPDDVEAHYRGIEGVTELVVCGVISAAGSSDEIHCFVVKDTNAPRSDDEILKDIEAVGSSLPDYMRVRRTHFLDTIPRTSLQKPKRYLLTRMALEKVEQVDEEPVRGRDVESRPYDVVCGIVSRLAIGDQPILRTTRLVEDLGFDSLTMTEFLALVRKETGADLFRAMRPHISVDDVERALATYKEAPPQRIDDLKGYPEPRGWIDRTLFSWLAGLSKFAYRIRVEGVEHVPASGGYLLCPNHQTHLDGLWVLMHLPKEHRRRFCCMAKKEHLDTRLGRRLLRVAGGIPVDRYGNPGPAYERCLEKLKEGWVVLIHPEGTRTRDGTIGAFKPGAAKLSMEGGCPIVPVKIEGGYAVYSWDRALPKLFDLRHMRRYELTIRFGKPLRPLGRSVEGLTRELSEAVIQL